MKKFIMPLLAVLLCLCLFSCSKAPQTDADASSKPSAAAVPESSTTQKPSDDSKKAQKLKADIAKMLSADAENVKVSNDGSFEYKLSTFNEEQLYSMEYTEEIEKKAFDAIEKFAGTVSSYYPDKDKIERRTKNAEQINHGENGIDSVNYIAVYINTQNQQLKVYADSTGKIYYAKCDFTW